MNNVVNVGRSMCSISRYNDAGGTEGVRCRLTGIQDSTITIYRELR